MISRQNMIPALINGSVKSFFEVTPMIRHVNLYLRWLTQRNCVIHDHSSHSLCFRFIKNVSKTPFNDIRLTSKTFSRITSMEKNFQIRQMRARKKKKIKRTKIRRAADPKLINVCWWHSLKIKRSCVIWLKMLVKLKSNASCRELKYISKLIKCLSIMWISIFHSND